MDEKVFRFVAHTGFPHFEKGILWHERMYVSLHRFPSAFSFDSSARSLPLLTVTNFWERVSSTREYMMLLLIAFMLTVLQ
jgi:hypothetical protein